MKVLLNSFHLNSHTPDLKVTTTLNSTVLSSYMNGQKMLQDAIQSLEQTTDNGYHLSVSELTIIYFLSQAIEQNLKKLVFYYGATDHWAPASYYEDMKNKFPDGEIYLCERKFKHAFVLESSEEVAEMVAPWIQEVIVLGCQQGL